MLEADRNTRPVTLHEIHLLRSEIRRLRTKTVERKYTSIHLAELNLVEATLNQKVIEFFDYMFENTDDRTTLYSLELYAAQFVEYAATLKPKQMTKKNKGLKNMADTYSLGCNSYLSQLAKDMIDKSEREKND